jgi:hypothetical protein
MGIAGTAGATEAFRVNADYGDAEYVSRRREHAVGASQLAELASSGRGQRAQRLPASARLCAERFGEVTP